jgi:hypothetical protein
MRFTLHLVTVVVAGFLAVSCGGQDNDLEQNEVCLGEGEPATPSEKCCEGLVPRQASFFDTDLGQCEKEDSTDGLVCTACGDGVCGVGENQCNCEKDCQRPCLAAGETFEDKDPEGHCCDGLTAVLDRTFQERGGCVDPKCECYVCTACGDGVCGPGESLCNCLADCR